MSAALVKATWSSPAPSFLRNGVLGALAYWARDDGTFADPPTVNKLIDHDHYPSGKRLHERAVQYQLRICERLGLLIIAPDHIGGRGHARTYKLCLTAIQTLTVEAVQADLEARLALRKGCNGCTLSADSAKGATKGATKPDKGCNKGCNQPVSPYIEESTKKKRAETPPAGRPKEHGTPTQLTFGPGMATTGLVRGSAEWLRLDAIVKENNKTRFAA
jgi:hypothetical protein